MIDQKFYALIDGFMEYTDIRSSLHQQEPSYFTFHP